ncbi:MAG: hypothetical protein IIC10_00430 [Proteobacteria bacterium]|nr:hypothetical protein [Pseudomonadota bacterium]
MDILSLVHKQQTMAVVSRRHILAVNDLLMLQGSHDDIDSFASAHDLTMLSAENARKEILHSEDSQIAGVVITEIACGIFSSGPGMCCYCTEKETNCRRRSFA